MDITDEHGTAKLPVKGGKWFTEMSVGKSLLDYDSMVVLTHFKGHTMVGFGSSNKNIGIGCADGQVGKAMIHAKDGNDWNVVEEELMEKSQNRPKLQLITLVSWTFLYESFLSFGEKDYRFGLFSSPYIRRKKLFLYSLGVHPVCALNTRIK